MTLGQNIVCPVFIGRGRALEELYGAFEVVRAGQGRTVGVTGDAGIGKSRLLAEAKSTARQVGMLVLEGHCFEFDRTLPYAPLLDLLRIRFSGMSPEEISLELGSAAPGFSKLLPELRMFVQGFEPLVSLEPEQEKRRLFHDLSQFFIGEATIQPVLMVVEDLHWSDDTSLEFLLSLARRASAHPILLILSYRSDEVGPSLRHLLAEFDRERLAREIVLKPFTRAEVAAMLQAVIEPEMPIRIEFLDSLFTLTEGNPFFVEEVVESLMVAGEPSAPWDRDFPKEVRIPRSVQDAVVRRVIRVSVPAQRVLSLAAVAGQRFDFSLLQALAGNEESELLGYIKELMEVQLVTEESEERFAFRHALTRQAVYAQLLARERRALHRTIMETIEQLSLRSPELHLSDLAYHSYLAGIWDKALFYATRMGERAQAMYAPQAAIEHFTHALEAAQQMGMGGDGATYNPATWLALHRARGQSYEIKGEFERAESDYGVALDAASGSGDRGSEWQALLDLGFLWLARDYERAGDFFRRSLELADRMDDSKQRAHSLNRLGNWHANIDQPKPGHDLHRQALAIFRELDDLPGIAETLDLMAVSDHILGDRRSAIEHFEEAATIFRTLNKRRDLASVLATLGHLRCASRVFDTLPVATRTKGQSIAECEEALAIARGIGWRSGESYALSEAAAVLATEGEYGPALAYAGESLAVAEDIQHQEGLAIAHSTLGIIYLDLLAAPQARRHCEIAYTKARGAGSPHLAGLPAAFLAAVYLLEEEPTRARAFLKELMVLDTLPETLTQSVLLATYGETSLADGESEEALRIATRLIAWAEQAGGAGVIPRLWKLQGEALAALGKQAEAEAVLLTSLETARQQGARPLLWRIRLSLGFLLQAQGRREEAKEAFADARAIIEELASTVTDEAVQNEFRSRALAQVPAGSPSKLSARRATKQEYGGLTAREREVAVLVARGLSNRQIAAKLVVSERTVETHTGKIRGKLGFVSRAEVAAWAVEQGLASTGK